MKKAGLILLVMLQLTLLVACSDSSPGTSTPDKKLSMNKQSSDAVADENVMSAQPSRLSTDDTTKSTLASELDSDVQDDSPVDPKEMAELEALMLKNTQLLTERQKDQSELANIAELENLSEAHRDTIKQQSARETAEAAQRKAEQQAVSEVLKRIPQ